MRSRQVAHHQSGGVHPGRFLVFRVNPGIADVRVGQRDDLAAVRRVGEDLLVAGHRGVEDHFTGRRSARADGAAPKHRPVGKDEDGGIGRWHGKLPD